MIHDMDMGVNSQASNVVECDETVKSNPCFEVQSLRLTGHILVGRSLHIPSSALLSASRKPL